jgi:hypothetical protein
MYYFFFFPLYVKKITKKEEYNQPKKKEEYMGSSRKCDLVALCRERGWRGYSRFDKKGLLSFVRVCAFGRTLQATKLQRWVRGLQAQRSVNDSDFSTLEPFTGPEPLFRLAENGHLYVFRARSLLMSILVSGKFENPYTRSPLTAAAVERLHYMYCRFHDPRVHLPLECRLPDRTVVVTPVVDMLEMQAEIEYYAALTRAEEETVLFLSDEARDVHREILGQAADSVQEVGSTGVVNIFGFLLPLLHQRVQEMVALRPEQSRDLLREFERDCLLQVQHIESPANYLSVLYHDLLTDLLRC